MEESNISDPIAVSFLHTSRSYCRSIERPDWNNAEAFIEAIHKIPVQLYSYGLELALIDSTKCYADTLELEEGILDAALHNIKTGTPFQYYWTIINQLELDMPSTGAGDLIDDLFDIYKDLKLGITYFDKGSDKEWAFWTFKMTFLNHWSDHCVSAIQVMY